MRVLQYANAAEGYDTGYDSSHARRLFSTWTKAWLPSVLSLNRELRYSKADWLSCG